MSDNDVFIFFLRYLPESPRWLMSQGRFAEVKAIMKTCAKINGKEFPEHLLPQLEVIKSLFFKKKPPYLITKVLQFTTRLSCFTEKNDRKP